LKTHKAILCVLIIIALLLCYFCCIGKKNPSLISLFPLAHYDQEINDWLSPLRPDYNKLLLTLDQQAMRQVEFYRHYFGNESPWNPGYVKQIFSQSVSQDLKALEEKKINSFANPPSPSNKIGYGENFRPYPEKWLEQLRDHIHLHQFTAQKYDFTKRAIAINNIAARLLPTEEPHFYSYTIPGQGYPFDNLQAAVVWAGTPVYILGETLDQDWSMVLTPGLIAWVKSTDIARVNQHFVAEWLQSARHNLVAITNTQVPIVDTENGIFRFSAYIGMIFPAVKSRAGIQILIPVMDDKRQAHIHHAHFFNQRMVLMPLSATPHHFVAIMRHLLGRPYGWGGMYFYNDCSAELKNLYTPFGIWLPVHSSSQVNPEKLLGKAVDLSSPAPRPRERLIYLQQKGHPFMTIIYIGNHVLGYLGSYPDPTDPMHHIVPLSYQNVWGVKPKGGVERRAVIGKSVLFPLLTQYPEDPSLKTELNKTTFQIMYLDEFPENILPSAVLKVPKVDLSTLLSP
jgi:hypothetical protein